MVIVDAVQFLPAETVTAKTAKPLQPQEDTKQLAQQVQQLQAELKKHAKTRPQQPVAMGVRDQQQPADWHIHVRFVPAVSA